VRGRRNVSARARAARVVPLSNWMRASAALMIVHQFVAFALYVTPLIFMFERLWGSHNARWYIRLPLRLPVGERRRLPGCQSRLHAVRGRTDWGLVLYSPCMWRCSSYIQRACMIFRARRTQ